MDARIKSGHDELVWRNEGSDCFVRTPTSFQQPHCLLTRVHDPATRCARVVHLSLAPSEGVGNAGCPLHPQPRVRFALVKSTRVNEYTGITRRSRTQWFYDLLRALPGDRACLTPSSADMACLKPGRARHASANLTPTTEASGPHDFAVRSNIVRQRAV